MDRIISVRKLAALELVFHGPGFVLIEFGGASVLAGGLGVLSLRSGLSGAGHPVTWEIALGVRLVSIAANYLPLLIHAAALTRAGSARQVVAHELEESRLSQRRYGVQQLLLLVPVGFVAIAIAQAVRSSSDQLRAAIN